VYLREDLGAAAAVAGLGFIALQGMQTVGRLLGDRVVTRYGDRAVARAGAGLACAAMAAALAAPATATTVIAFGAVGLGIGTLIPASLRSADGLPGLPRGVGLSLVGTVVRIAVLASPALIGVAADAFSLRAALAAMPLAAAVVLVLTPTLPARR
jgi:MFS family permease